MKNHNRIHARLRAVFAGRLALGVTASLMLAGAATLARAGDVDPEAECGIFDEWAAQGDDEYGLAFIHAATGTSYTKPNTHQWLVGPSPSSDRQGEVHPTWSEGSWVEHPLTGCSSEGR